MLHYRLEGSGHPLLLIHGWGVTYTIWQNLTPLLTQHFQLVMIELPGIGGSPDVDPQRPYYPACAEAIEEVRQFLGIERWAVLAYSSGTRAAEAYVQRYAENVTHTIFLCPIYLNEICALGVRFLTTAHISQSFTNWLFSDWRLASLVIALGFNGRRNNYSRLWLEEIELQPLDTLVRMLCELPGSGRAPFELPAVPTLFIWGSRDPLTARPFLPRANHVVISANHSAPMQAASAVAQAVIPFLTNAPVPIYTGSRLKRSRRRRELVEAREARQRAHLLTLIRNASHTRFPRRKRARWQQEERTMLL